ncbi:MAG: Nramp family divalent metal transporter [Nitrososphaerota archaeon]|jgi:manganese transport protein|nr:Nramp family divalent metal transporter [Nitrososphaerota archaeon]MDG6903354.1 Nramp family divalent metal transporter [Nitrososphaerota archaeon]MDG6911784.1 Nramp family divalent metal transporter [Nitrososphaerota archaeon]MDG6940734.1 Nramp family divalent metal transporter [Nitrososphaerota archaeon]MDG6945661.1 Nramp family divalent metal transporter [Nitrososphaerota archaeon]
MKWSSVREFTAYLGPALIVSMAYMDPGNYGTAIQSGALFQNKLVWAVWLASIMAMELQYLSGKLGIATGQSLTELLRSSLRSRYYRVTYWLAAEAAAAATDLAEYLGTVLALNILFGIPLLYAALLGALDVLLILAFASRRFRVIEYMFMVFVSVISVGFLYEIYVFGPNFADIVRHTFVPTLNRENIPFVVGIVGATVMPHALFLHSHLTKDKVKGNTLEERRRVRKLHLIESVLTLTVAALVNVAILVVAGRALCPTYGCVGNMNINALTVTGAAKVMDGLYGPLAGVVFGVTLLASGIASSTTGTLAGQAIMEGMLGTRVNVYARRVVTRVINVFPTVVAILVGLSPLSLLVYSQVVLSIMIPLPMVPLIYYTAKRDLMGEFVNRRSTTLVALVIGGTIVALNAYLLVTL